MVNIMGWWNKLVRDKKKKGISAKDKATAMGEPYIEVISVNFDKASPGDGFFELEWNKIFVQSLQDAGYSGTDEDENLCYNLVYYNLLRNI